MSTTMHHSPIAPGLARFTTVYTSELADITLDVRTSPGIPSLDVLDMPSGMILAAMDLARPGMADHDPSRAMPGRVTVWLARPRDRETLRTMPREDAARIIADAVVAHARAWSSRARGDYLTTVADVTYPDGTVAPCYAIVSQGNGFAVTVSRALELQGREGMAYSHPHPVYPADFGTWFGPDFAPFGADRQRQAR